mgnify:FL=1|jgi:hypothetical protein
MPDWGQASVSALVSLAPSDAAAAVAAGAEGFESRFEDEEQTEIAAESSRLPFTELEAPSSTTVVGAGGDKDGAQSGSAPVELGFGSITSGLGSCGWQPLACR